jgi:hypothetical protein
MATSTTSLAVVAGPFAKRTRISLKRAEQTLLAAFALDRLGRDEP